MFNNISERIKLIFVNLKDNVLIIYQRLFKKKINRRCDLKEGEFIIKGSKEKFIIKKDDRFEFLKKNGRIIAFKDLSISNDFVYYNKGERRWD